MLLDFDYWRVQDLCKSFEQTRPPCDFSCTATHGAIVLIWSRVDRTDAGRCLCRHCKTEHIGSGRDRHPAHDRASRTQGFHRTMRTQCHILSILSFGRRNRKRERERERATQSRPAQQHFPVHRSADRSVNRGASIKCTCVSPRWGHRLEDSEPRFLLPQEVIYQEQSKLHEVGDQVSNLQAPELGGTCLRSILS